LLVAARRTTRRETDEGVDAAVDEPEASPDDPELIDELDPDDAFDEADIEEAEIDEPDIEEAEIDEDDLDDDLDDEDAGLDDEEALEETGLEDAELEGEDTDEVPVVAAPLPPEAEFDDDDDELVAAVTGDDDTDDEATEVDGLRDGEFVCRSCFMAKRDTQLADPDRLLCRDCA
jgi:hypothetical protein